MGTDLVRYKDRWALGVKEMREIFIRLEGDYPRESQQVWRQYWDYQLYKALEYQYTQGLECINKTLPEVEIKMVFRQHKLQVRVMMCRCGFIWMSHRRSTDPSAPFSVRSALGGDSNQGRDWVIKHLKLSHHSLT